MVQQSPNLGRSGRRVASAVLAASLVFGVALPALAGSEPAVKSPAASTATSEASPLAAPKISRAEAIAAVRKVFNIPADLGEPNVSLYQSSDPGSQPQWNLSWQTREGVKPALSYSASVDAMTGEIVGYSFNRADETQPPLSLTRSEALTRARDWLNKLAARYAEGDQLRLRERRLQEYYFYAGAPAQYTFEWERLAEGYPVQNNGVTITIDARTGELVGYSLNWNRDLRLTRPEKIVELSDAEGAYRNGVKLGLVFVQYWQPGTDKPTWKLVYRPLQNYPVVGAVTGELVDPNSGQPAGQQSWSDLTPLPAPAQPYAAPAQPLTQEQALALAKQIAGQDRNPDGISYQENNNPRPQQTYNFNWQSKTEGKRQPTDRDVYVTIDALTGLVQSYNSWGPDPEDPEQATPAVDQPAAREKAIAWLVKYRPDLAAQVKLMPPAPDRYNWCRQPGEPNTADNSRPICSEYSFSFQMFHAGIPLLGYTAQVQVNVWTGEVIGFWANDPLTADVIAQLPAGDGAITAAQAMDAFLQYDPLRPTWVSFWDSADDMARKLGRKAGPRSALAYVPDSTDSGNAVDALTGHLLDSSGRDLNKLSAEPKDITGHWAQKEIEILLVRGIFELDDDAMFHPARSVTRGEAARWLVLAKGMRPYMYTGKYAFADMAAGSMNPAAQEAAPFAEAALDSGIILRDELGEVFAPEKPVSREEFALWAVRAMGYGAIARMKTQIPVAYTDAGEIGAAYRNAVGVLAGLGILSGQGSFRPQDSITRAEAAVILFAVASEARN